jgi:hypothetical protein
VAKISNGRVVIEVPDEKALHYCTSMGYHIVKDESAEEVPLQETRVTPKRGRPRKEVS